MSDLAFIEHTASAVYHERDIFEVFGEIPAGTEADIQLFSRCLTEEFREFHAADISALPVVSAALGNKNGIADRWNATQLITDLQGDGFTVVPMGMGFKDMSPPMKELYKLLLGGMFIHGGNPVLRWMAGNVVAEIDAAENIKPSKKKSTEKIDGIVAWIMALDRCIRHELEGSVYDEPDHDLIVL